VDTISAKKFRIVVCGIVTSKGKILIGKKKEKEDKSHPIEGQWHLPGGHLEAEEEPEEAIKREIEEETGLNIEVHQVVDVTNQTWNSETSPFQVTYHCESETLNAEPKSDLEETKWVEPGNLLNELGHHTEETMEVRPELKQFIEKISKMPAI